MPANPPKNRQTLGAAAIVAAALLIGSLVIAHSLDGVTAQLVEATGRLQVGLAETKAALASARPAEVRRGPDPNRRYSLNIAGSPVRGPSDAKVTIVEFSDFQCPFCSRVNPTLAQIYQAYPKQVRVVYKHLPLDMHAKAPAAHAVAEAAARQGKFWEMHDKIFSNQKDMAPEKYTEWAAELGLDVAKFEQDRVSLQVKARVDADKKEAEQLGITGTPSFFVNGKFRSGALPFETFKELIDSELGVKQGA